MLLPLLFCLYQRAHIATMQGTEYVVYMFQSLAHAETAEENNLRAGGRGFSPATKRVTPGYFYWKIEEK